MVKKVFVIIVFLWFVVGFIVLLLLVVRKFIFNLIVNVYFCVEIWFFKYFKVYKIVMLVMFYVMFFVFMVVVYYKIGRKVWISVDKTRIMKFLIKYVLNFKLCLMKIVLVIILSFVVFWILFNIMMLFFFYDWKNFLYLKEVMYVV